MFRTINTLGVFTQPTHSQSHFWHLLAAKKCKNLDWSFGSKCFIIQRDTRQLACFFLNLLIDYCLICQRTWLLALLSVNTHTDGGTKIPSEKNKYRNLSSQDYSKCCHHWPWSICPWRVPSPLLHPSFSGVSTGLELIGGPWGFFHFQTGINLGGKW